MQAASKSTTYAVFVKNILKVLLHRPLSSSQAAGHARPDANLSQMLRSSLKISTSDISAIDSQASFWEFFDVLVEKLFQTEWYNGKVSV